jgi:LacI family transcriptional regulator
MSRRRVTLDDVAREADVSLATADRVVNRREGVRPKTVAQVERAISKLGYRVNVAAARLARNRSLRFAFLLPSTVNPFMTELAEQVSATAECVLHGAQGHLASATYTPPPATSLRVSCA